MKVILLSAFVAGAAAAELKLHAATKTHVHAEYNGLAAEIKHLGEKGGVARLYDADTGETFVQMKTVDGESGPRKTQFFDNKPMEFELGNLPQQYGEQLLEFLEHPKVAGLAQLSEQLGSSEAEHDVAFWVHQLALSQSHVGEKSSEAMLEENEGEAMLEENEGEEVGWGRRRRRRRRRRRGGALGNKCGNSCFGRCGPGCTKWSWVCGDDNAHKGCWEHDCYCSCKGMWHYRCIGFLSDSCWWPGCAAGQCGGGWNNPGFCN